MQCLFVSHSREPILQLLELLDIACYSAGLPQCSQLFKRFLNLCDRLKSLHHGVSKLSPCAKDWLVTLRYTLEDRIHPGAAAPSTLMATTSSQFGRGVDCINCIYRSIWVSQTRAPGCLLPEYHAMGLLTSSDQPQQFGVQNPLRWSLAFP